MANVSDSVLLYELPKDFRPGTDLSSKLILQSSNIINKLIMTINEAPSNIYIAASTAFFDGSECDVLYIPKSNMFNNFPPILIEIQQMVNTQKI